MTNAHILVLGAVVASAISLPRLSSGDSSSSAKERLTVRDEIETTRAMTDNGSWNRTALNGSMQRSGRRSVFISPDGMRYAVMLVTGDVKANGDWVTLLAGETTSVEAAAHPRVVAKLFTTALGTDHGPPDPAELMIPGVNPPFWLDNERVIFYWSDAKGVRQLVSVNVVSGKMEYLTHHTSDVVDFRLGPGGSLMFSASAYQPLSKEQLNQIRTRGFTVQNTDLIAVLMGQGANTDRLYDAENRFLSSLSRPDIVRPVHGPTLGTDELRIPWVMRPEFSPDGRWLIIDSTPAVFPQDWLAYSGSEGRYLAAQVQGRGRTAQNQVKQLFLVDVRSGQARPLWNAPLSGEFKSSIMLSWGPDSRSVIVGPTFLPPNVGSAAGRSGSALVEVDTQTGAFSEMPMPAGMDPGEGTGVRWQSLSRVEVERNGRDNLCFTKSADAWRNIPCRSTGSQDNGKPESVRVELRQDIHTPPALYAVDTRSGRERKVLELNPTLQTRFLLGDVEMIEWNDSRGRAWKGRLYHPIQEAPGQKYPLVIQTHGTANADEYSLTGLSAPLPGLGPGASIYAAEPIASLGMFVLQVEDKRVDGMTGTPEEPKLYMDAIESGIRYLVAGRPVDPSRIGIAGFSRLAWIVEYFLTHSTVHLSAAIVADGFDGGYFLSMTQWIPEAQALIGAPPFGKGLLTWLINSPPFDADKVRVPLQMQAYERGNAGVMTQWEMFARLRILGRPAEMYLIPDIEHGTHALQNPGQCLAAQQRAVDWWDFWLNGHEDPDPEKAGQYRSWRGMRGILSSSNQTSEETISGQPW